MDETEQYGGDDDLDLRRPGESPRFVALHRSAMSAYGLPLGVAVGVVPLGLIAWMVSGNPVFGGFLWAAVILIVRALSSYDPNFVRVFIIALETRFEVRNKGRWGGASWTPLPTTGPVSAAQVPAAPVPLFVHRAMGRA